MIFFADVELPEGPVLLHDGSLAVTEMTAERGCVAIIDRDGKERRVVAKTGRPNGLAVDRDGVLFVAESRQRALLRLTLDGEVSVVADSCAGRRFLWPNDLCFGPDGAIYLTDSGTLIDDFLVGGRAPADFSQVTLDGSVYRIDPVTGATSKIDGGILFTNGIAFGPDGHLYVGETATGNIYRYRTIDGTVQSSRETWANVLDPDYREPGLRGPDGMAFDENGRLYVTVFGQGDVTILDGNGAVARRIALAGKAPTNVAFGPRGQRRIYVTENEHGTIEAYDVDADGLALYA